VSVLALAYTSKTSTVTPVAATARSPCPTRVIR
jgi:hypothetical protein